MQEIWYSIIGDITPDTAKQLVSWVNGQVYENPVTTLKILLSSEGGDVESALIIYHYIKSLPLQTEIIAFNKVGSAANIIFVSSTNRSATKDCLFVLHEGTNTINNPTASLHQHEDNLLWMKDRISRHVSVLSAETGKTITEIKKAMSDTVFLSAEDAKVFGLVRDVVEKLPLKMVKKD
ncbi:MAG TPA: ATP-dependent Clp protease proteolytic subunit [Mucilaginibacter sp.]|nr:ATP-dependent Clp protease proteolytic subunit [Mucilaginibacter sp.]